MATHKKTPPTSCPECRGVLRIEVIEGPLGPIVSAVCGACFFARTPYDGPGAQKAIRAAKGWAPR